MKRDMELIRLILLEIEKAPDASSIADLPVDGYTTSVVAYHCKLLYEAGFVSDYDDLFAEGELCDFSVGGLTWEGYDYLDCIRDDSLWGKTKDTIKDKGLPLMIDTIKTIANAFITSVAEGVANSILKNGGA